VVSETEVLYWLAEGVKNRAVGFTQLNAESSRSHLLLTLTVERAGADGAAARLGKLLLVDLAGSEKVKKTGAAAHALLICCALICSLSRDALFYHPQLCIFFSLFPGLPRRTAALFQAPLATCWTRRSRSTSPFQRWATSSRR
jgi:hypothetical protein